MHHRFIVHFEYQNNIYMTAVRNHLLPLFLLTLLFQAHSQEMSFEEYNPKSTLVVTENIVEKAKYPFIDIHNCIYEIHSCFSGRI